MALLEWQVYAAETSGPLRNKSMTTLLVLWVNLVRQFEYLIPVITSLIPHLHTEAHYGVPRIPFLEKLSTN